MSRRTRAVAVAVNACMASSGQRCAQRRELPVLRTEVVAPLADAVRFVHGEEARPAAGRAARRSCRCPRRPAAPARRRPAGTGRRGCRAHASAFWPAERAVDARRRHAVADERVHLVLHQRDQRRDDDRERRRGSAPAPGSTATCRRRSAGRRSSRVRQHGVHRLALERAEGRVAPVLLEDLGQGHR